MNSIVFGEKTLNASGNSKVYDGLDGEIDKFLMKIVGVGERIQSLGVVGGGVWSGSESSYSAASSDDIW